MTKETEKELTDKEKALLAVIYSKDIGAMNKLYIVQHLVDSGNKTDSVSISSDNCPLPDLQMRPNSTTDFNNLLKSVEKFD